MAKKAGKKDKHGHNFIIFSQAAGQTWYHIMHITYPPLLSRARTPVLLRDRTLRKWLSKFWRNEANFTLFWSNVNLKRMDLDVMQPSLPRKRKKPACYEVGNAEAEFHETVEDQYRHIYHEAIQWHNCWHLTRLFRSRWIPNVIKLG